jgi:hypothetical protein
MSRADYLVRSVITPDGAVLLDVQRGTITTLNPTGALVWQELRRGQGLDKIVLGLSQLTGQDQFTIEQDVRDFIDVLKHHNLLPTHAGPAQ